MFRLHDLDELVLNVRNDTSKTYIREAINAYKGGALRAAIISVWIAVSYDIISKIREIADLGDKEAKKEIDEFEALINTNQKTKEVIRKMQDFENSLLEKANKKYEFINSTEFDYINRIKVDRNLSAHPAFIDNGNLFQPTGELVKSHIVHSIIYLLKHKPTQGKVVFSKVIRDIKSNSFPADYKVASKYLNEQYFNNCKVNLIKALTIGLLKGLLHGDVKNDGNELNVINTLLTISESYPETYDKYLKNKINGIINNLEDKQLSNILTLLKEDSGVWNYIDTPSKIRIKGYLASELEVERVLLNKFSFASNIQIEELNPVINNLKSEVEKIINLKIKEYGEVRSYNGAYEFGKNKILPYIPYYNEDNIHNFILAVIKNQNNQKQIIPASGSDKIFEAVYDGTTNLLEITKEYWYKLIPYIKDEEDEDDDYYDTLVSKIKK